MDLRLAARRIAGMGDNLNELGMTAEFGQDPEAMSTHTMLELDDLESFDSRIDGMPQCTHPRAIPGSECCPECGAQLDW